MKKFRPLISDAELLQLKRLSKLDFSKYNETEVREFFLIELLKLLGYQSGTDYSISLEQSFPLNNLSLYPGSKRIKLDYICSLRKQYFWLIEAKEGKCRNPLRPPKIRAKDVEQAFFYSQHPEVNCRYFVVSNGWYIQLYDRDTLAGKLTPILAIKHTDLPEKFLELDQYVGATQILPMVKEKILDQIEKVFASEIRIERLDEFIDEVKEKAARVRGKVEEAAREIYFKNHPENEALKLLDQEDISTSVYSVFQNIRVRFEINYVADKLVTRLVNNRSKYSFNEYTFFSRLLLENPYPVNYYYYPHVLHFLFQAKAVGLDSISYNRKSISELLEDWLNLCLFHLSDRPIMRYLWVCERIFAKISKQSLIMMPSLREKVKNLLNSELFYIPEEKLIHLGPNQASVVIQTVETSLAQFRSAFINKYYDFKKHQFHESLAKQYYLQLVHTSDLMDEQFGGQYEKLKNELGNDWSDLNSYDQILFDRMGSVVCDILLYNEKQLGPLTEAQRKRISQLAELKNVNCASALCNKLNIAFRDDIDEEARKRDIEKFFDPSANQRD
ncbi:MULTISPECIES: type I restriction enzyme HsdR N-terminal domain-containing protein [Niastella]|uniref:Type I restriction enzyme HsdR N-terminal domain-containing protein n=1 Tax=Niastella soli TaxID=2821487 RepID=A0ABS3Z232_9BACT|nr:type I restriction enzyme HsdR N-terminal domain-containing protein [Niastella soli]MBO9204210.1 type I restriction enzyme HsdR N-terminal domain-containing protein [Niastella soli]